MERSSKKNVDSGQRPVAATGLQQSASPLEFSRQKQGQNEDKANAADPVKRGSNLACLKCRAIKVKCWKAHTSDPRCARCNRLDLFCEFREHHRGKKLEKLIQDQDRSRLESPEVLLQARTRLALCSSFPINIELGALMGLDAEQNSSQLSSTSASSTPLSSYSSLVATSVYDDVARLSQISWQDACYLFNLFVTHLNPVLALLDTQLHTPSYTRERHPLLFSAILSVSSRYFRPEVYQRCSSAVEAVLNLAEAERVCSLDHIQALIVQSIWYELGDPRRPKKLVKAISLAYELGLPFGFEKADSRASEIEPGHHQPSDPHLNTIRTRTQQRTWVQLCLLELSQQANTAKVWNRPQLIATSDMPTARLWHDSDSEEMGACDARLAFLMDLALGQTGYNQIAETTSSGALRQMVEELESRQASCTDAWFKGHGDEQVFRYGIDQYSRIELGFLIPFSRFARAKQIWACATKLCIQDPRDRLAKDQENTWLNKTTTLAFSVLDNFVSKILGHELLRMSPHYVSLGCFGAAQWLLSQSTRLSDATMERAKAKIGQILGLLARPQYYPDGSRVVETDQAGGILDQALRSITEITPALGSAASSSDSGQDSRGPRSSSSSKRRRTSNASSLFRLENGVESVGSRSEGDEAERGPEWPPHAWMGATQSTWSDGLTGLGSHRDPSWAATPIQHHSRGMMSAIEPTQSGPWPFSVSAPDVYRNAYISARYDQQGQQQLQYMSEATSSDFGTGGEAMANGVVGAGAHMQFAKVPHRDEYHTGSGSYNSSRSSSLPSSYLSQGQQVIPFPPQHYQQLQHHERRHEDRMGRQEPTSQLSDSELHGLFSQIGDDSILDWQQQLDRSKIDRTRHT